MLFEIIIGGALIVTAVLICMTVFSVRLKKREYIIAANKLTRPITAVHISDLHECAFGKGQSRLLRMVRSAAPDLIVITGDIVEDDDPDPDKTTLLPEGNRARELFVKLRDTAPCYMVLGNHESNIPNTSLLCSEIEALGIRLLHRRNPSDADMREEVDILGERLLICGADDPYFDRCERRKVKRSVSERLSEDKAKHSGIIDAWRERLRGEYADIKNEERLTLLLSHRPEEYELYRELSFDAAFSGHAHGGQWRLPPFINGVYAPHQGFFPKHAGGCYRYGGFTHIVSRGLSKKRMVRIFNRPEVCVVRFVPTYEKE